MRMGPKDFVRQLPSLRLNEALPQARQAFTLRNVRQELSQGFQTYKERYVDTSSSQPIFHAIFALTGFSYLLAWPEEYRHKKARLTASLFFHPSFYVAGCQERVD